MNETEIERLVVRLVGDPSSYQKMLRDAPKLAEQAARRISRSMTQLGRTMSLRITAPLTIMGGLGVRSYAKFDQAMIESTSIMKVTEEQTRRLAQTAKDLSRTAPQGPEELANSYYFLASAGLDAEKSMAALPKVARFATAGAFDMATATDLLTDAQTALGIAMDPQQKNMELLGDQMVLAAKQANASVQQFAESVTADAGVAARNFGMDIKTVMALLGGYASAGKKAAEGGNLLGRATRLLSKAYRENAGVFKEHNIKVINEATGEYQNFIDIIGDMERAMASMTKPQVGELLSKLGFEALAQKSILPLIGMSKQMKNWEKAQEDAAGTTKDVFQKQMKSFTNQMKLVRNNLKIMGIEIGEVLAPMLTRLGELVKSVTGLFQRMSPESKRLAVMLAVAAAAIGPLLIGLGSLVALAGLAVGGLAVLLSPMVLLGAAIASLGTYLLFWTEAGGKALQWFGRQWQRMIDYVQPAIDGVKNAIAAGDIQLAFKIAWAQVRLTWVEGIKPLREAWIGFIFVFKKFWIEATSTIQSVWNKAVHSLARGMVKVKGWFFQESEEMIRGTLAVLDEMEDAVAKRLIGTKASMLAAAEALTTENMEAIQDAITKLEAERDRLAIAAGKAAGQAASVATEELEKTGLGNFPSPEMPGIMPRIPQVTVPVKYERIDAAAWGSAEHKARYLEYQAGTPAGRMAAGRGKEAEAIDRTNMAKDIHDLTETAREFWGDDKSGMFTLKWSELN